MLPRGRAGVARLGYAGFAPATENQLGNNNPAWTGSSGNVPDAPAPHPSTQPMGGHIGRFDGASGADPWRPKRSPFPRFVALAPESASGDGAGPALGGGRPASEIDPLGYGYGVQRTDGTGSDGGSNASRLGRPGGDPFPQERQSWWRGGIQGFNDQLQVRDRHAFWSTGKARNTGPLDSQSQWNGRNPQLDGPPMATLETVNISVNPQEQVGPFQDDLTRPYTWLGQQDGSRVPIYGGVPGLWQSYGNRGFSDRIHDPSNGEGGRVMVTSGPPHGLHSDTLPDGKQLIDRYKATAQMRPVRLDRPSNSRIAGQSFSQTVETQGGSGGQRSSAPNFGVHLNIGGGWRGGSG